MIKRKMLKKDFSPFSILTFIYFLLFPFGQLLRIETNLLGIPFTTHPLDIVVMASIPLMLLSTFNAHPLRKYFTYFWVVCIFSLFLSVMKYPIPEVVRGSLYLIRFISYYFFFELVWNVTHKSEAMKQKVLHILINALGLTALLGWVQYFFLPDLRWLKLFNWDDHLYRLTGTLLDPGFMGILMVFGFLISVILYFHKKQKSILVYSAIFLITCLFTYARASYLSLVVGVLSISFQAILQRMRKSQSSIANWIPAYAGMTVLVLVSLGGMLFMLPRTAGEGVKLERTNSIFEKFKNYGETSEIIANNPVFGVGFNTYCSELTRSFENKEKSFESHACSGSDSSILFILATTGVVGAIVLLNALMQIPTYITKSKYSQMFFVCGLTLIIHSLFLNSFFYPWVMGIMAILMALAV